jgi:hypothetical protein
MALTTYSELQTETAAWLKRTGVSATTDKVTLFIALFEAWGNRNIRARNMQARETLTPTSGVASLPSDFLAVRRLTWAGSTSRVLEYVNPDYFDLSNPTSASSDADYYTIEGSSIYVSPISDTSLTLLYWEKIPALADDNTTNWLLTRAPDVYLAGCLAAGCMWLKNAQEASQWASVRDQAVAELKRVDNFEMPGAMAIRALGTAP